MATNLGLPVQVLDFLTTSLPHASFHYDEEASLPAEGYRDQVAVFRSEAVDLRLIVDREQMFLDVGPRNTKNDWYDLAYVTSFIAGDSPGGERPWAYERPRGAHPMERQLRRLVERLVQYFHEISHLMSEDPRTLRRTELDQFIMAWSKEIFQGRTKP